MTTFQSGSEPSNDRQSSEWGSSGRLGTKIQLTPVRIALMYLVLGFSALFLSDVLFVQYLSDPLLSQVQAVKGGAEVVLTAGFILVVTGRREAQLARKQRNIEHQREELQVLHRVLRHNLRNDVNVIQGYTELIRDRISEDKVEEKCEKILNIAGQMTHYTDQAKRINRVTELSAATRTEDLSSLISEILDENPSLSDGVDVEISLPNAAEVEVNPRFKEALREVMDNAVAHNDSGSPALLIDVNPGDAGQDYVSIRILDNGPGIPDSQIAPVKQGGEEQMLHLNGMGLWLVEWTVDSSGGRVEYLSREEGTEVLIEVPKSNSGIWGPLSKLSSF